MKSILLALSPSPQSRHAAEVLAGVVKHLPDSEILLLTVIPQWPEGVGLISADTPLPPAGEVHGDLDRRAELIAAQALLREMSLLLREQGVAEQRLRRLIRPQVNGVARDVLEVAEQEGCDTIVVGRRNQSKVQSLLLGSVSSAIVQNAVGRSVWVVE